MTDANSQGNCPKALWLFLFCFVFVSQFLAVEAQDSEVKIWMEEEVIPTYPVGDPDPNPIFYNGRVYQGAQGHVYPYPLLDKLSNEKIDRKHKVVYLENEYLKVGVMPGPGGGGRIHLAQDKTNGYDFFYKQSVLRPGLIGVLGAWWSGGVEWNFPHHHRTSNFLPLDYTLEANPDGSKTVWVGEIETRHRLKWMVGLTLHPGRSTLEMTAKLFNRTPLTHSFLFWSNVSVHVDDTYQFIFPPSQQWTTGHGKHTFSQWPYATGDTVLGRRGYEEGQDLSWWKNSTSSISIFSFLSDEDFFAGYNHGKQAGVVHVADHHLVPGKKMWSWGTGERAQVWDKILTDTDGPYIELMIGAYQDNQPDYSWMQPFEVKTFTQTWYPLRDIGGVKNANLEAAVNLEVQDGSVVRVGLNTSSKRDGAEVLVQAGDRVLLRERVDISPAEPFVRELPLPANLSIKDLKVSLLSSDGEELISYKPVDVDPEPEPTPVVPPLPPKEVPTIEELYLAGLRLVQFHSAALSPDPYWEEALRRDPGDYRTNTALGLLYIKRGRFSEAEERLEAALERATENQTIPMDGAAYYYLGLAQSALGKKEAAYRTFYRATWSYAWHGPAYFALAELATAKGDYTSAFDFLRRSLSTNQLNTRALNLTVSLLRRSGDLDEADALARQVLDWDPLDSRALYERYLLSRITGSEEKNQLEREVTIRLRGSLQSYLELALDYSGNGLYDEGIEVLSRALELKPASDVAVSMSGKGLTDGSMAMAYYYVGLLYMEKGEEEKATRSFRMASIQPTELVFPFRLEAYEALEAAIAKHPDDAAAHYYLGNLLFESQPEKAVREWERSRSLKPGFATVHRNLGIAYARLQDDIPAALASLEKAVESDPTDPRLYLELDQLAERGKVAPAERLARLERNQDVVDQDYNLLMREASLYVQVGDYAKAANLLESRHFHVWEGGGRIHDIFVDAYLAQGQQRMRDGAYSKALQDFKRALDYPLNLEVGRPRNGGRAPEVYYYVALAEMALELAAEAEGHLEMATASGISPKSPLAYYQALAFRQLGNEEKATQILNEMIRSAEQSLEAGEGDRFFAKFGERESEGARLAEAHFLLGLGFLGKGRKVEARKEFEAALALNLNHLQVRRQLAEM